MTDEQREVLIDALTSYQFERSLDTLPKDNEGKYYDYDSENNPDYSTADAKLANTLNDLISELL